MSKLHLIAGKGGIGDALMVHSKCIVKYKSEETYIYAITRDTLI